MSQMGKNALLMGAMAVVAAAVGLYAWYGVKEPSEREEARKEADAKLLSFGEAENAKQDGGVQLSKITVRARGATTTLERKEGAWRITAPVNAGVDQVAVDGLTSQLTTGRFKDVIEQKPTSEDLRRYGLDAPRFTVTATAHANGTTRELIIQGGVENTFDGSVYVQRDQDPRVYSVQGGLRWALEKSTFDLRDKQVLAVPDKELVKLEVKAPNNAYVLEQTAPDNWRLRSPENTDADKDAVTALLNGLKNHRASAFLADSADARSKAGLDKPAATAVFHRRSGEPLRLQFGKDAAGKVFVLRTDGSESILAEVPEAAITSIDKGALDLRDKTVLAFKKEDVSRIAFTQGAQRIIVERVAKAAGVSEDWKMVSPKEGPAQKWKLSSILWMLGSLEATSFGEENPRSWATYGLDKPERTVELYGRDGKVLAALAVGKPVEAEQTVHFVRGSRNQVLRMETSRLSELPSSADDLLQTSALPLATPSPTPP